MRTTLDLGEDVLLAAKELAATQGKTAGEVITELARKGLAASSARVSVRNGVPVLPRRAKTSPRPTMALVNSLRDTP
jgi:uncharacterized metal-binding protein